MAKAFPKSEFYGFDSHPASIEAANSHARDQQITNVQFSIAPQAALPVPPKLPGYLAGQFG
jgi:tRNA G46 methylase TrmB